MAARRFSLLPGLPEADYRTDGGLANVRSWQARIVAGNSGDVPPGGWDRVGYVMVGKDADVLVPIGMSDEHSMGYEALAKLLRAHGVRAALSDFVAVPVPAACALFLNHDDDGRRLLPVVRRWREAGGPNNEVRGAYTRTPCLMFMDDLVERGGDIAVRRGVLAPYGDILVGRLRRLSDAADAWRAAPGDVRRERACLQAAGRVVALFDSFETRHYMALLGRDRYGYLDGLKADLAAWRGTGDLRALEEGIFGFDGLKNRVHNAVRAAVGRDDREAREVVEIFGDLDLALNLLSDLGLPAALRRADEDEDRAPPAP